MARGNGTIDEVWLAEDASKAAYESRMESALGNSAVLTRMSDEVRKYVKEQNDNDGYEYVSVGEFIKRVVSGAAEFVSSHILFFVIVAFIIVASVIMAFGRINSLVMIFVAFILLALLAAILLYIRWQDWKDKREALARAEMLYKAAQNAKKAQGAKKETAEAAQKKGTPEPSPKKAEA